jgi:SpoVK/Ycf46/Vps4 family AAA+-type ATPase
MFGYGFRPPPPKDIEPDPRFVNISEEELYSLRWRFIFDAEPVFQPVNRENLVGMDHTLKELDVFIKMIKNYSKLNKINAKLDTGIIFSGPPGSGKTYAARYVGTQSGARFINIIDFPVLKRFNKADVMVLFGLMKKYVEDKKQPIVAFWDEFDTFANVGDNADKIEALSSFKTELSGVNGQMEGVFLIAATNQPHLIPADVVRPGRLGKKVYFKSLKRHAKKALLEHFVNQYNHCDNIDFESMSFLLSADFPADIEELIKDVWRNTAIENIDTDSQPILTPECLASTLIKKTRGFPDDIVLSDEEVEAIAIYEIGRAIVARTLNFQVQLIALEKIGYPDAYRVSQDEHFSAHYLLSRIKDAIAVHYGGIKAQEICGIGANTNQIPDFMAATTVAQRYAEQFRATKAGTELSLSALAEARGSQHLPPLENSGMNIFNDTTAEVNEVLQEQQRITGAILNHYGTAGIQKMAKALIEKGFFLQMDIDGMLDPDFKIPTGLDGKAKPRKAGF